MIENSPEDLHKALFLAYISDHWRNGCAVDSDIADPFRARLIDAANIYHADIFDLGGGARTATAAYKFIYHCIENGAMNAPNSWFYVMLEAFNRGVINRIAWGAMARLCYIHCDFYGSEEPDHVRRHLKKLDALRRASPYGLMKAEERRLLASMPERVTLYRAAWAEDIEQATQGISWTRFSHFPHWHLHLNTIKLRFVGPSRQIIVAAEVDRKAIFAATTYATGEVMLDFQRSALSQVREIKKMGPVSVLLSALSAPRPASIAA